MGNREFNDILYINNKHTITIIIINTKAQRPLGVEWFLYKIWTNFIFRRQLQNLHQTSASWLKKKEPFIRELRIQLKLNTALLSTRPSVRVFVTGVTSHISHIYKGINAMFGAPDVPVLRVRKSHFHCFSSLKKRYFQCPNFQTKIWDLFWNQGC